MRELILLLCLSGVLGRHDQYEGHQLYQIKGPAKDIALLEGPLDLLSAKPASAETAAILQAVVRLSPQERLTWLPVFESKGIEYNLVAENLADVLRNEDSSIKWAKATKDSRNMTWDAYYRHQEINDYLDGLAEQYPNLVTMINGGLSYEGRQIKYVRISSTRFEDLRKPVIIIDAAIHAREWVTPPVALYIIHQLVVENPNGDLTQLIDWIIMPMTNPDGYEYSIDVDRLWRKTRSRSHPGSESCPGVDGNRNFDHHWGTSSSAAVPCAITYEGPTPFSEPETRVIRDVVLQYRDRTEMYITLHSYGNMFLYAYGHNASLPSNGLILHLTGVRMATAIGELALEKADKYIVGNAAVVLYFTTGTSRDWTRAVGIPLTYTLELPGYEYMFTVPPTYVEQIVTETWAGISAGASYIIGN